MPSQSSQDQGSKKVPKCSNCGAPSSEAYRPFCSRRCADADLGRWLTGSYAIAGEPGADEDGESAGEVPDGGLTGGRKR